MLFYIHQEVNDEDEQALEKFMSHNPPARRTLADIIQEKLTEKKTEIQSQMTGEVLFICLEIQSFISCSFGAKIGPHSQSQKASFFTIV